MISNTESIHEVIKKRIVSASSKLGFTAKGEYKGTDWRADVVVITNSGKIAFEVQITNQSLNRTLERQKKYIRDGVLGCWLFEKAPKKMLEERPDLPLFPIIMEKDEIYISLNGRKNLLLDVFIEEFIQKRIRFCSTAVTSPKQNIHLVFYTMKCWKCGAENHLYFVDYDFHSSCHSKIHYDEMLWDSDKKEYLPEILSFVRNYCNTDKGAKIRLASIKERYSKTVDSTYMSFGCNSCDSIFGDWYIHEAVLEARYGGGVVDEVSCELEMNLGLRKKIPHWCYPGDDDFCE